jgi:hypothetical protein
MWTLESKRIFVQEYTIMGTQIIPRLQPLTGGTILQWFGYESKRFSLTGLVVGNTDKDALQGMYDDGASRTLVGPYSISQECYVKDISINLLPITCQTLRPDLAEDSPVYNVKLELYEA